MIEGADFTGADLRHALLRRTTGPDPVFRGKLMERADLERAVLAGADLATAQGLRSDELALASGDAAARLLRGMTVKACGAEGRDE